MSRLEAFASFLNIDIHIITCKDKESKYMYVFSKSYS